ncbi:hypothetical protein EYF80_046851 [Liparis tanakae]|uniref:Uncharacterized protein n=1 Tax=Liparis tanakae TaxID=230148 RepID=A0A4Z2FPI4_9TELE|nr:hypothetical protein EYF80_046851 [Liparis tanakae]
MVPSDSRCSVTQSREEQKVLDVFIAAEEAIQVQSSDSLGSVSQAGGSMSSIRITVHSPGSLNTAHRQM